MYIYIIYILRIYVYISIYIYTHTYELILKILYTPLACVAQWIECQPANQRVPGSIPSQDTCLGCRQGPQWGTHVRGNHTLMFISLFFPPSPSL